MKGSNRGSVTQAIKARLNIADLVRRYVTLTRAGNRLVAPCPFHQETKPSFSVNEEEGFFYCFGCQASGDLFDFYARINGLEFREALEQLAEEAGVRLDEPGSAPSGKSASDAEFRRAALKMHEQATAFYVRCLQGPMGEECRAYVEKRRIAPEILEQFAVGWAPRDWRQLADTLRRSGFSPEAAVKAGLLSASDRGAPYDRFRGRLMFPIRNLSGQTIAFGGRIIADEDTAKYINSADSPLYKKGDNLYGLFQARRSISAKKSVMLTEGYMDVLTLHQFGHANACGVLGTALTQEQVKRLAGFAPELELLFDGDAPGRKAALRSCEMVLTRGLRCKVVLLPEGEDIDSLLHGSGPEAFEVLRTKAPEGVDFCIRMLGEMAPREAVDWVKGFLAKVEVPELLPRYTQAFARGLGLDATLIAKPGAQSQGRQAAGGAPAKGSVRLAADAQLHLLRFLVWFPHQHPALAESGAEMLIRQPWATEIWTAVEESGPGYTVTAIEEKLTGAARDFWFRERLSKPNEYEEEAELKQITQSVREKCSERQKENCVKALRQISSGGDFDRELLQALQDTVRRGHG